MEIWHNPNCTKSKLTLQLLKDKKVQDLTIVEYLKNPPELKKIQETLQLLNLKPVEYMRKKEDVFIEHEEKIRKMDEIEQIQFMIDNPKLMERPVVISQNAAAIGRPPENIEVLFNS